MGRSKLALYALSGAALALVASLSLLSRVAAQSGPAAAGMTLTTLIDRAQIEDLLVEYYSHLGPGSSSFGAYYLADGVLDVNGVVAQGQQQIEALYRRIAQGSPGLKGNFRMLLTNPRVVVHGDTATADMIWTGISSDTKESTPHLVEQGREHDDLIKRQGHWYFKYRVITSDGGLQPMFEKTYKQR
ncbi:MAG TPA: nuclear transport factor 2 family protein [Steroidobacteraceae bacterium]|nr:nuclear transport factor 2 family protein [Steroidobacteraceae bacterium]